MAECYSHYATVYFNTFIDVLLQSFVYFGPDSLFLFGPGGFSFCSLLFTTDVFSSFFGPAFGLGRPDQP